MARTFPRIVYLKLSGFRPFRDFEAQFSPLEVIAGANASGKSSLFQFLRFLRDGVDRDIPPEIVAGSIGQQVFHKPGPDRFAWQVGVAGIDGCPVTYDGEVLGPVGNIGFGREVAGVTGTAPVDLGERRRAAAIAYLMPGPAVKKPPRLGLGEPPTGSEWLLRLRQFVLSWRFHSAFQIDQERIRRSVPTEQEATLREDAGNLSAVLFCLMTEHPCAFEELQTHLRSVIPGFRRLSVKARGGPGEVIAFWEEEGVDADLTLADLSDGTLRFLCWATLCVTPTPPSLICIDEPDQGVHPRTLPVLAALFQKASERTQILLAAHSSYFLTQFPIENLAVMVKRDGRALYVKPKDSPALVDILGDFGPEEIEAMHRNDELEALA